MRDRHITIECPACRNHFNIIVLIPEEQMSPRPVRKKPWWDKYPLTHFVHLLKKE